MVFVIKSINENNDGIIGDVIDASGNPYTSSYDEDTPVFGKQYAVFKPTQIKSATGNKGTFDKDDPNINFQIIGETGAANLDKAEEAITRLDNLRVAKEMETYDLAA